MLLLSLGAHPALIFHSSRDSVYFELLKPIKAHLVLGKHLMHSEGMHTVTLCNKKQQTETLESTGCLPPSYTIYL